MYQTVMDYKQEEIYNEALSWRTKNKNIKNVKDQ